MPSVQAKLFYHFFKLIWPKKDLDKNALPMKRIRARNMGKFLLSSLPVHRKATKINGVEVDIISPNNQTNNKIVLFIHGGGYVYPMSEGTYEFVNRLAIATQAKVFVVHYQLAPENPFPTQINEVKKVYEGLLRLGNKPQDIFLVGESAGGNIGIATALLLRDKKLSLPGGIIAISAPTDGTFSYKSFMSKKDTDIILTQQKMHFFLDAYRGKTPVTNPYISPIFAILKGLPKIQLFVADNELPFDDVVNFSHKLKEAKVPYELHVGKSLSHDYPLAARFIPEAKESIRLMTKFITEG